MIRPVASDGQLERGGVFEPIFRPRVVERLRSASLYPITLIVAAAGYGKSLAITHYLSANEGHHLRFNVQPEHANFLGFLRGFTEAIADVAPDVRKSLQSAYEANASLSNAGEMLALWLHSHLKSYTGLIVIDDLHRTEDEPRVSHFLSSLISQSRTRCKWIIASRSTTGLPVGSWLAYGDMDLTIDEHDLRFTIDEAKEAARAARVSVRSEELEQLLIMTDGWPTALSFALRSSTRSVDLRNIKANTQELVYKYLAEQVYRGLSDEEKALLHFVSYLDDVEVEVLREAGYTRAKSVIEGLRDRVAFIYAERPNVYRCHDLFRAFLQHQIELQGDDDVGALQRRVAQTLEKSGKLPGALRLFSDIGSSEDIVRLLERHGFELYDQGHGDTVLRALGVLHQQIRARNPTVLGLRGMLAADSGRLDRAESLLHRAIAFAETPNQHALLAIRLSLILANQMKDVSPILDGVRSEGILTNLRGEVISLLAIAHAYAGRGRQALDAIREAELIAEAVDSDHDRAKILHRVSTAMARLGLDVEKVRAMQERAATLAGEQALFSLAGRCFCSLASIALFYEGDSAREFWYAQQAATASMKAGDRINLQTALLQLMDIEGRRGNNDRLQALEKQLAAVATSDASRLVYVVPVRAMAAAWSGNFDQAHRLMGTVAGNARFFDFDLAVNAATDALFLLAERLREEALDKVVTALALIENTKSTVPHGLRQNDLARSLCIIVESMAGRRIAAERLSRAPRIARGPAVDALRKAALVVARSWPEVQPDEFAQPLEELTDSGYGGLSRVVRIAFERCRAAVDDSGELTEAQVEILQALADGRTPKEIARATGRSLYTIQTHIQNMIKRLGCSGRNEALSAARNRGILK